MNVLSEAQDAIIQFGNTNAITITSSSNTLENVIDGLTIDLIQAQDSDDSAINVEVEVDTDTVETNLESFVDTFNTLIDSLSDLYADDGDLDGNSTLRSIISSLKNSMRSSLPDGYDLSDLGLSFTSTGTLEIDSDALEEALTNNPDILNICLTDEGGVFEAIQDLLDPYTESGGILSDMEDSAQDSLDRVTARQEAWDTKMENLYNLYLEDFTQMQITLAELESSLSILSS
jgi:flagellar hook-associated protein 2